MRKLAEKVVIVAQICITLVFAIITLLNMTAVFPENEIAVNNGVLTSLIIVLFLLYLGLSVYLIYVNFSERENVKQVLLFCDSESATRTTAKVVKNIVNSCAKQTTGITVRKTKIRSDEKKGFAITLRVNVNADNVAETIDTFRCLLADSFKNTLGLSFNTINFEINKLQTRYVPNGPTAEEKAEKLGDQREVTAEIYDNPLDNEIELNAPDEEQKDETTNGE